MLANQGVAATLRTAADRVIGRLRRRTSHDASMQTAEAAGTKASGQPAVHSFDRTYGVDTSGLIWGEELVTGSRSDRWNTAYYGIAPSVFRTVLSHIQDALPNTVFVDMGSGKGRGVMLAMDYPFKAIYGVELSSQLSEIAQSNLDRYRQVAASAVPVKLLCLDAVDFEFPADPLVLFFYHPFCKPVLQKVLQNLEISLQRNPRPVHIVYINTELRQLLDSSKFLKKIFEATLTMSPDDQLDDRVGSTQEECAIYRSIL